jgi:hypothetical protein
MIKEGENSLDDVNLYGAIRAYPVDSIQLMADIQRKRKQAQKKAKQVQAKLKQVLFRVSDEEFESMQKAAEAEDRTVSAWVRVKIRSCLREPDLAQEKKEQ